jgi:hypothetical protein
MRKEEFMPLVTAYAMKHELVTLDATKTPEQVISVYGLSEETPHQAGRVT